MDAGGRNTTFATNLSQNNMETQYHDLFTNSLTQKMIPEYEDSWEGWHEI